MSRRPRPTPPPPDTENPFARFSSALQRAEAARNECRREASERLDQEARLEYRTCVAYRESAEGIEQSKRDLREDQGFWFGEVAFPALLFFVAPLFVLLMALLSFRVLSWVAAGFVRR